MVSPGTTDHEIDLTGSPAGPAGIVALSIDLPGQRWKESSLAQLVTDDRATVKEVGGSQVRQRQYTYE